MYSIFSVLMVHPRRGIDIISIFLCTLTNAERAIDISMALYLVYGVIMSVLFYVWCNYFHLVLPARHSAHCGEGAPAVWGES